MPTISRMKESIQHPDGSVKEIVIEFKYSSKMRTFKVHIPDFMGKLFIEEELKDAWDKGELRYNEHDGHIYASDEDLLKKAYTGLAKKWRETYTKQNLKKIIQYDFSFDTREYTKHGSSTITHSISNPLASPINNDSNFTALKFDFEIIYVSKYKGYNHYYTLDFKNLYGRRFGSDMDWTPEREAFFEELRDGFRDLIDRAYKFLRIPNLKYRVDLLIESGMKLLPPAKEEKIKRDEK